MPWEPRRKDPPGGRRARRDRAAKLRRWTGVAALAAGGAGALYLGLTDPPRWTPMAAPGPITHQCRHNAYNCSDFGTRARAQAVCQACGGLRNDVHGLDADGDGLACERLP